VINYITYLILTYSTALYTIPEAEDLAQNIVELSNKYGHDPILVTALGLRESGFDQTRVNEKSKSFGVMMLHPKFWGKGVPKDDMTANLERGLEALEYYRKKCGGVPTKAIAAYRLGEAGCNTVGPGTKKVMKLYRKFTKKYYDNIVIHIGDVLVVSR
jgi:hypothetical protein